MADRFRREMDYKCSVGGVKCPCCNPYRASRQKDQPKLRRVVRSVLKRELKKEVDVESI